MNAPVSAAEARLAALGLQLPPPPPPMADYDSFRRSGSRLYLAGQGPLVGGVCPAHLRGRLGRELTLEQGAEAARLAALNVLSILRLAAGDLDRVRLLRVLGFVACTDTFALHPAVIDGASALFRAVLGENGGHSRVALGTNSLPFDTPVEIEVFAELLPR